MSLSRRQFLTGVGAAGLAAAGSGLAGCGKATTPPAASGATETALIPQAYLNPQDYDFKKKTTDFKTLLSPLKFGSIDLKHRMIKSAAGSATYLAGPTDEMLQYYVNFAKGGVEFIWIESVGWMAPPGSSPWPSAIKLSEADAKAFGRKLVEECAKYGASLGIQWGAFASKAIADLTKEDIAKAQDMGVTTAKWYQEMGFKALEIHITGGGLANSLLSRFTNTRKDEYGTGSLENRARFVTETIQKIKQACGKDFVIEGLVECVVENDNVTNNVGEAFKWMDKDITLPHNKTSTIEEGIEFVKMFEAAGIDAVQLRLGIPSYHPCQFASDLYFMLNGIEGSNAYGIQWDFKRHFQGQFIANHSGAGMLLDIAKRYKDAVKIAVGSVTYMDPRIAPDFFEGALAEGKLDYYAMTRPLTVDPEYVNKLRTGRVDEIAPCCRCLHCHIGGNESNRKMGYCRVNALTQRVMSGVPGTPTSYDLPPLKGTAKKVMVIGGGPAGMEAARIAAARGHTVTLYEKTGALGGRMTFASRIKGPHQNIDDFTAYLTKQLEVNKVKVVLNKKVDTAFINSEAPDAAILAVGSLPGEVDGASGGSVPVIDFDSFETAKMGENVIVYGSNAQAWDCALWLTVHKKNVQIVTPNPNEDLDKQQSQHEMRMMTTALYSLGVKAWPGSTIKNVGSGEITIATDYGVEIKLAADAIINAADLKPNKSLLDGVSVKETYAIGDCSEPYNIALAVRAGNDVGRAI